MTVKEIIELEEHNSDKIYLLKEGIFYRAYNRSAMRLNTSFNPYKVHSKYIKNVNQEIYYCGFPLAVLEKVKQWAIENGFQVIAENEKIIAIQNVPANDNYTKWQEQQNLVVKEPVFQYGKRSDIGDIIRQIQHYPVISKTPVEAFNFLADIQKQLYELKKDGIIL